MAVQSLTIFLHKCNLHFCILYTKTRYPAVFRLANYEFELKFRNSKFKMADRLSWTAIQNWFDSNKIQHSRVFEVADCDFQFGRPISYFKILPSTKYPPKWIIFLIFIQYFEFPIF